MRRKLFYVCAIALAVALVAGCKASATGRAAYNPFDDDAEIAVEITLANY